MWGCLCRARPAGVSRQPVLAVTRGAEPTRYAGSPPFSTRHLSAVTCGPEMLRGKILKSTICKSPRMGISPLSGVRTPCTPPPLVTEGPCGCQTSCCGHSVFTAPPFCLIIAPKCKWSDAGHGTRPGAAVERACRRSPCMSSSVRTVCQASAGSWNVHPVDRGNTV